MKFGELFRHFRIALNDKSLRQNCMDIGLDPGNLCSMEKGKVNPPLTHGRLKELCEKFNMTESQFLRLRELAYAHHAEKLKKRWGIK